MRGEMDVGNQALIVFDDSPEGNEMKMDVKYYRLIVAKTSRNSAMVAIIHPNLPES